MKKRIAFIFRFMFASLAVLGLSAMSKSSAAAQNEPTIAKDSVQVVPFTVNSYKGNFDLWSWLPRVDFRVSGPIPSGGQLYVDFAIPGSPLKFDCPTEQIQAGSWHKASCGARDIGEEKSTTYTGPVSFSIRMRNELAGGDIVLFNGKAKVAKVRTNEVGPKAVNRWVYYVDHDWNLPIGYVFLSGDPVFGFKRPEVNVAFWVRGEAIKFDPHLFYQGKEIGKMFYEGMEVGKPSCESEIENLTTHSVDASLPQKATWARVVCNFNNVRAWDTTSEGPTMAGPLFLLSSNPGEYEFKLLWNNKLARTIKFKVLPDGKFDYGTSTANKLGSERAIVPVQVLGDQDGQWNRNAWKTDAFYGNPLTGFTAIP